MKLLYIATRLRHGVTSSSCEITLHCNEKDALEIIRSYMGGIVKKRSGVNAYRYRLHRADYMRVLALSMVGRLHTP